MDKNLFISHSSYDKDVVEIFANLIRRVSLNQIYIWFSNDTGIHGGFMAGDNWFETILNNLKCSQAVISFITPNSNDKPWILYESGYAEALKSSKLIPVKFLINVEQVSTPLQQKQIFGFSNIEEANILIKKILDAFDIAFDEEVFHDLIVKKLNEMRSCFELKDKQSNKKENPYEILSHKLDNYFDMIMKVKLNCETSQVEYEIPIEYEDKFGKQIIEYIKIEYTTTISDVLDKIFFILGGKVRAYSYLEEWIIKDKKIDRYVVVSDFQDMIPANCIFKPYSEWVVIYLDKPYTPNNTYNKNNICKVGFDFFKKHWK